MVQTRIIGVPLTFAEAQGLTKQIQGAADGLWQLIKQAYEGKAWVVLGYSSWQSYIKSKFGLSKEHSYRLLAQGRVVTAIEEVLGPKSDTRVTPAVSIRQAREMAPRLEEALGDLKGRLDANEEPGQAVDEVVKKYSSRAEYNQDVMRQAAEPLLMDPTKDLHRVYTAARMLAQGWSELPVAVAIQRIYGERDIRTHVRSLQLAIDHLTEIRDALQVGGHNGGA